MEHRGNSSPFRLNVLMIPTPPSSTECWNQCSRIFITTTEPSRDFTNFYLTEWSVSCVDKDTSIKNDRLQSKNHSILKSNWILSWVYGHDYVMCKKFQKSIHVHHWNWLTFAIETGRIVWSMNFWIIFSWIVAESHDFNFFL